MWRHTYAYTAAFDKLLLLPKTHDQSKTSSVYSIRRLGGCYVFEVLGNVSILYVHRYI